MTSTTHDETEPRDVFSLAFASTSELIEALGAPETIADDGDGVPPPANQIARLIASEAVRLIRLGTRTEVGDAADALAQFLIRPAAGELQERRPDAYRVVVGAAVALDAAVAPSSSGGELTVLRSWNGKALELVALVNRSDGQRLPRAQLREAIDFGDAAESSLSHLLADLEAAGLIVRTRDGRNVMVHLGSAARSDHVQTILTAHDASVATESDQARFEVLRDTLQPFLEVGGEQPPPAAAAIPGAKALLTKLKGRGGATRDRPAVIETFPVADETSFKVVEAGQEHPAMVGRGRVENGRLVEVQSFTPVEHPFNRIRTSRPVSSRRETKFVPSDGGLGYATLSSLPYVLDKDDNDGTVSQDAEDRGGRVSRVMVHAGED